MKTTIDYSASPTKAFDAVEDVKDWFGDRYDTVAALMKDVKDCGQFAAYCSFTGVEGFPVRAWYEHFNGQGSWNQAQVEALYVD